jgi:hypothetical protein
MSVPEWAMDLPSDLQSAEVIKNTPDLETAAKRLVDLDRYKGSSLALPKDGDEAAMKSFSEAVSKRGFIRGEVPADPSGYDAEVDLSKVGLGDDWKEGRLKEYHSLGLTKAQAKKALAQEVGSMESAYGAITEKHGDAGMAAIRRAAEKYGLDGNPTGVLSLLMEIGMNMSEDGTKPSASGGSSGLSLTDIDAKIAEVNSTITSLPEYDARVKQALEHKFQLIKQRAVLLSGDRSIANMTMADASKALRG